MGYRTILQVLLILAIISTLCICIMKPQMHKSVLVYNSDYIVTPTQEAETEVQQVPVMEMASGAGDSKDTADNTVEIQTFDYAHPEVSYQTVSKISPAVSVQTSSTKIKNTGNTVQKTETTSPKVSSQKVTNTTPSINLQKILDNNKSIQSETSKQVQSAPSPVKTVEPASTPITSTKSAQAPVASQTTVKTVQNAPAPKVLSAAEEEIAWNIWRSNLQNQLMRDVKLPVIPQGTRFDYSFTVDKYGKVTDVKTYANPSTYTPYAIQYIAPVIRSYQGRSILNFPVGSQRVTTVAKGAWKISSNSKYSTPQDYNDIEKVIK